MQVSLSNLPDGHDAHHGLGVLVHGDLRVGGYRNGHQENVEDEEIDLRRFNPLQVSSHSHPPNRRAVGDLGNMQPYIINRSVNTNGTVKHIIYFSPTSDSSMSLKNTERSVIGRMFVVYESPDDGTQPNGNVGKPMLWGVIGIGMPASVNPVSKMINSAIGSSSSSIETFDQLVCTLVSSNPNSYVLVKLKLVYFLEYWIKIWK